MTTPNKDREGNMNEQNKLTYEQLEYTVERLRNRISELTAPPSDGEIDAIESALIMKWSNNIYINPKDIAKATAVEAITKWQEMRVI